MQESNTSTEDEAQIQPDPRKKVQKKTVKPSRQELVVPNESQSESESKFESEKPAMKPEFTEGIFWRPTVSLPNSMVKTKPGHKQPAKQLVQPNPAKTNSKAITTQADVAVSPKVPSPKISLFL